MQGGEGERQEFREARALYTDKGDIQVSSSSTLYTLHILQAVLGYEATGYAGGLSSGLLAATRLLAGSGISSVLPLLYLCSSYNMLISRSFTSN